MVSCHPSEPMVNERRLPDPGPGNDGNDVDILVCPSTIQKSDVFFSTKNTDSGDGQFGDGNLLWRGSYWRLASSDTQRGRGHLLQVLTTDSTPCVDSAYYRRNRLDKFSWALKTSTRVFLEEHLKQKNCRLWDTF